MIIREIVHQPMIALTYFDFFNDTKDTLNWLNAQMEGTKDNIRKKELGEIFQMLERADKKFWQTRHQNSIPELKDLPQSSMDDLWGFMRKVTVRSIDTGRLQVFEFQDSNRKILVTMEDFGPIHGSDPEIPKAEIIECPEGE